MNVAGAGGATNGTSAAAGAPAAGASGQVAPSRFELYLSEDKDTELHVDNEGTLIVRLEFGPDCDWLTASLGGAIDWDGGDTFSGVSSSYYLTTNISGAFIDETTAVVDVDLSALQDDGTTCERHRSATVYFEPDPCRFFNYIEIRAPDSLWTEPPLPTAILGESVPISARVYPSYTAPFCNFVNPTEVTFTVQGPAAVATLAGPSSVLSEEGMSHTTLVAGSQPGVVTVTAAAAGLSFSREVQVVPVVEAVAWSAATSNEQATHVDGSGTLLVATSSSGLRLLDTTAPAHPVVVGSYPPSNGPSAGTWPFVSLDVESTKAHVATSDGCYAAIDLGDPEDPSELGRLCEWMPSGSYTESLAASAVRADADLAYVVGQSWLTILTVADPSAFGVAYASMREDPTVRATDFFGRNAEAFLIDQAQLRALEVANPSEAAVTWQTGIAAGTRRYLEKLGDYLLVLADSKLSVWDAASLSNLQPVVSDFGTSAQGPLVVSGSVAYVAGGTTPSLDVVDLSDPTDPQGLGSVPINCSAADLYANPPYLYVACADGGGISVVDLKAAGL